MSSTPTLYRWRIGVEIRQHGAIGIFEIGPWTVDATTREEAIRLASEAARTAGWETRGAMALSAPTVAPVGTTPTEEE